MRTQLITVDPLVLPSGGVATPDHAAALLSLYRAVISRGGTWIVTSLTRDMDEQRVMYQRYLNWINAGKPAKSSSKFNAATMKADVVARPGYSWHNAGRAVDISIRNLKFPGVPDDKKLDLLWELARPLGFRPIIKTPDEYASEAWHHDFMGPWAGLFNRRGDYAEAAMAACLDIGKTGYGRDTEREIQAHLHRLGIDVGAIDGILGQRSRSGLARLDLDEHTSADALRVLRSL